MLSIRTLFLVCVVFILSPRSTTAAARNRSPWPLLTTQAHLDISFDDTGPHNAHYVFITLQTCLKYKIPNIVHVTAELRRFIKFTVLPVGALLNRQNQLMSWLRQQALTSLLLLAMRTAICVEGAKLLLGSILGQSTERLQETYVLHKNGPAMFCIKRWQSRCKAEAPSREIHLSCWLWTSKCPGTPEAGSGALV